MNSKVILQAVVVGILAAALCIALLVSFLLPPGGITGAHPSQTGIMLTAPPSGGRSLV